MVISIGHLQPIIALIAGILILVMPRLLNYIVAIYLIVKGFRPSPILSGPPATAAVPTDRVETPS